MKRINMVALGVGLTFALGLGLSGMTQPAKVIGFLNVAGAWDPSLALVMIGAIAVHFVFVRRAKKADAPRFAKSFSLPTKTAIDGRLLAGAALFGIGWGIAGFCPGPALVSLVTLRPTVIVFVAAMLTGKWLHAMAFERKPGRGHVEQAVRGVTAP